MTARRLKARIKLGWGLSLKVTTTTLFSVHMAPVFSKLSASPRSELTVSERYDDEESVWKHILKITPRIQTFTADPVPSLKDAA